MHLPHSLDPYQGSSVTQIEHNRSVTRDIAKPMARAAPPKRGGILWRVGANEAVAKSNQADN